MIHRTGIGLDVHARSIKAAAYVPKTGEVVEKASNTTRKWLRNGRRACPNLRNAPTNPGLPGSICSASSKPAAWSARSAPPRSSGDRKTDKRDTVFLACMLAVDNIVEVAVPEPAMEAARDLARAREDARGRT